MIKRNARTGILMAPHIYSYRRVSSTRQLDGLGFDLQVTDDLLNELSVKYNLPIHKEEYSDKGISAYKGQHLNNELGLFLKDIEVGKIGEGSIIVVYSLDRLSRQDLGLAKQTYLNITNNGVSIYSVLDNHLYNAHNAADEIISTIIFERANNESKTKSERTLNTALKRVQDHQSGIRTDDGYAYLISLGNNPWWITNREDKAVVEDPTYFEIAKQIHKRILAGEGTLKLLHYLNKNYPPPKPKNKLKYIDRVSEWKYTTVSKFHKNKALFGLKETTISGVKYSLKGYYPAVITEQEWLTLQSIKKARKSSDGNRKRYSLFTGIGKAKCFHCGAPIATGLCSDTRNSRYYCSGKRNHQNGCHGFNMKGQWIDEALLQACTMNVITEEDDDFDDTELLALNAELKDKKARQAILVKLITEGYRIDLSANNIRKLENDVVLIEQQIQEQLELKAAAESYIRDSKYYQKLIVGWDRISKQALDETNQELRKEIRDHVINRYFKTIEIAKLKEGYAFIFRFINGSVDYYHHNAQRGKNAELTKFDGKDKNEKLYRAKDLPLMERARNAMERARNAMDRVSTEYELVNLSND